MLSTLDLAPFLHAWIYPFLAALLTGCVGYVMLSSRSWMAAHADFLGAQRLAQIAALENQALANGVAFIMKYVQAKGDALHPIVDGWIIRSAAQMALNHAAGVLTSQGNSPDDVANRLLAALPPNQIKLDTTGETVSKLIPVTVQDLPPIGESK